MAKAKWPISGTGPQNQRLMPADGLARLDLRQVQPPGFALVMAGELLKPAPGMLVLRGDRGGSALLGLHVEETHVVHAGQKAWIFPRFPPENGARSQPLEKPT